MSDLPGKRLLLLGEFGAFGRHLAVRLARLPGVTLMLAGPASRSTDAFARDQALGYQTIDNPDKRTLTSLLDGVFVVINIWRPLMGGRFLLPGLCAERGIHYVDLSDDRADVMGIKDLKQVAERHGALLASGAGVSPMLSDALVGLAVGDFDHLSEIHVTMVPGRDDGRELATARLILAHLDNPGHYREKGRWKPMGRWQRARVLRLPSPMGKLRGYFGELPELDVLSKHYGAGTVTARVGIRSFWFNLGLRLIHLVAGWRQQQRPLSWMMSLLRFAPHLPGGRGRSGAALRVEMHGKSGNEECTQVLTLVMRAAPGFALTSAPLMALVRKWVERGPDGAGAGSGAGLVGWDEISLELQREGTDVRLLRAWEKV